MGETFDRIRACAWNSNRGGIVVVIAFDDNVRRRCDRRTLGVVRQTRCAFAIRIGASVRSGSGPAEEYESI